MPYYKRRKNTHGRYPSYRRVRRPLYGRLDKVALNMAKKALSLMNVEFKFRDIESSTAVSTTATSNLLSGIAQGDTDITRDGSSCKIVSLGIRGNITINASAVASEVRLLIVLDKQTNQATFAIGDLLATANTIGFRNLDNNTRFRVLWDQRFNLSDQGPKIVKFQKFMKLQIKQKFDGTGATVADLTQNSIHIFKISTEATNTPTVTFFSRVKFIDN